MKLWSRLALATAGLGVIWVGFSFVAQAQGPKMPTPPAGIKSGTYFKNVTTSTLKELTPDDFLSAMGVITADLGLDCADCHPGAGGDKADFVSDALATKKKARQMIEMVAQINRTNFSGVQKVTCYTCHHAREIPVTSIPLDRLYSGPPQEDDDIVMSPPPGSSPSANEIVDKYLTAIGGAQRLAGITSFVATGTALGYGGFGGDADFALYAKAPNQRTTLITFTEHKDRGTSLWAFDGRVGWNRTPRGLFEEYELVGGELDGARLEAQLAFPGQIRQALSNLRVGLRRQIEDKDYLIVQGTGPRGLLATLYFDQETGLLRRLVRMVPSPVGRVPVQVDYSDYRDVNGVKFPFEYQFAWLDGRYTAKIKEIKTNVAIEASKFTRAAK
jgi:hypothetical protein